MRYKVLLMLVAVLLICLLSCSSSDDEGDRESGDCDVDFYDGDHLYCTTSVDAGEGVTEPTKPQRAGYDFVGWYDEAQKWNFSKNKAEDDLILEAKWRINLKAMFSSFSGDGIELDSNGAYLKIDTNPNDGYGAFNESVLVKIREANEKLDLPDSLYQEMITTASANGAQFLANEYVAVEWTNSPQTGLCVIYTRK